ncbi:MAG: hypothetical protein Q8L28_01480 [bacterium]|nr:hypothetical protein [bacterium]
MKRLISVIICLALLFASTSVSYAFSFGDFGSRFRNDEKREFREEKKVSSEGLRTEKRADSREEKLEKMRKFFGVMIKRYEAAVARLERLIGKIESRVGKIKEEYPAKNVSGIEAQITTAKSKLALIPPKIEELKADFEALLVSETPKESFKSLAKDIRAVKSDLKSIHKILVHVIGDIKGLKFGENI